MIELLNIPERCRINHKNTHDLKERIYSGETSEVASHVVKLEWIASLKPISTNMTPVRTATVRYDEIEVLHVEINDVQGLYRICKPIYKAIHYPCLLIVQYRAKFLLSACPFAAGKLDYDENILRAISFSHWLFPDLISPNAKKMLDIVSTQLTATSDIESVYNAIRHAIDNFGMSGMTKTHVATLMKDMLGVEAKDVYDCCSPRKVNSTIGSGIRARYSARGEQYVYSYDAEDVWHAFMVNERIRRVIERRMYRDMEDLVFSINSKYETYSRW